MSISERDHEALPRKSSSLETEKTAAASPDSKPQSHVVDITDVEACRSDSITEMQEPSIMKREPHKLRRALRDIWQQVLTCIPSCTQLWHKKEVEEHWKELPQRIKYEQIKDYSPGIPQLAAFINSNDNFCIWRSFSQLRSRVLFQKTLELQALERRLKKLDAKDDLAPETRYRLQIGEHHDGWDATQKELIDEIASKLAEFDDLMLKHHQIKSIPKPSKLSYESVLNYFWKNKPLVEGHDDFVFHVEDFVRLGQQPQNDQLHDRLVRWISRLSKSPLNRMFRDRKQQTEIGLQSYSSRRLDAVVRSFVTLLIIAILMVPILLLFLVPMEKALMAVVVLVSLFVFAVSLSLFRDSRPQDMFFGTATYCAVLLVFLAGQTSMNVVVQDAT